VSLILLQEQQHDVVMQEMGEAMEALMADLVLKGRWDLRVLELIFMYIFTIFTRFGLSCWKIWSMMETIKVKRIMSCS